MNRTLYDLLSLDRLLAALHAAGIRINFGKTGKLMVRPKARLSEDQATALKAWKPFILDFIEHQPGGHKEFDCLIYCAGEVFNFGQPVTISDGQAGSYCLACCQIVAETAGCICGNCDALRLPDGAIDFLEREQPAAEVLK